MGNQKMEVVGNDADELGDKSFFGYMQMSRDNTRQRQL